MYYKKQSQKGKIMFKNQTKVVMTACMLLALSGCVRLQPVYNVNEPIQSSSAKKISSADVGKIITAAAKQEGWQIKSDGVNKYKASISWREHSAVSEIVYSSNGYSINLVSSQNLLEGKGQIHKKYNQYVALLKNNIDQRLAKVGMK